MSRNPTLWHKGAPPHVGWWNASRYQDSECWRWWNGHFWSSPVLMRQPASVAGFAAISLAAGETSDIQWTYRWPKNGRVPRINPKTGEVTGRIV